MIDSESSLADLQDMIRGLLQPRLGAATIQEVVVGRDTDADGDDILRIRVVIELTDDHLQPDQTRGLVRSIRPRLADLGEEAFPILSFMTSAEARELGAAA